MSDETESVYWAAGALVAHLAHRDRLVAILTEDDPASPGAQSFEQDRVTGHETHLFCWEHEQDPADCHRRDRWAGDTHPDADSVPKHKRLPCTGKPVPAAADQVGELVVSGRLTSGVLDAIERLEANVARDVRALERIHEKWGPAVEVPPEKVAVGVSQDGLPGCQSCARLMVDGRPRWSDPNYNQGRPTDLGGALATRQLLCESCKAWALNHDHAKCVEHNAGVKKAGKKSSLKTISFKGPVHLPPVKGAFESLDLLQSTGFWRGAPGRAAYTIPTSEQLEDQEAEESRPERLARLREERRR